MKNQEKEHIRKYFKGIAGKDEDLVADIFLNKENESELKEIASDHWKDTSSSKVDLQHVLNKIHFQINTGKGKLSIQKRILLTYSKVAAVLLIPLLIAGIYFTVNSYNQNTALSEISAPKGSRVQFTLPDGSTGFLNGGSKLKYSSNFRSKRLVHLSGEGYFEVTKDKKHPFVVETKFADIQVLGTKFDVCAYDDDREVLTTLEEGSVSVFNKISHQNVLIKPGEQLNISTLNGKMKNSKVKTSLYTSWKEEILQFDDATFDEVVKQMERWYGIEIILDENLKYSESFTLTIKTESLRELLDLIAITTPISYTINNDTLYINQP